MEKTLTHTWELGGAKLEAEISPCSWMYTSYGLQISIKMTGGGDAHLLNKAVLWDRAQASDFDALVQRVGVGPCPRCARPAFDPKTVDTNRNGLCEKCFLDDLSVEFQQAEAEESAKVAENDREQVANGFTHRVTAWVHPPQGDDYQLDIYFKGEPKKAAIHAELKKKRSAELDDYQVIHLAQQTAGSPPDSKHRP